MLQPYDWTIRDCFTLFNLRLHRCFYNLHWRLMSGTSRTSWILCSKCTFNLPKWLSQFSQSSITLCVTMSKQALVSFLPAAIKWIGCAPKSFTFIWKQYISWCENTKGPQNIPNNYLNPRLLQNLSLTVVHCLIHMEHRVNVIYT